MRRRAMLAFALTFGLVAAAAATWLLASFEPGGTTSRPSVSVHTPAAKKEAVPASDGDEIGDESRKALREILREAE